MRYCIYAFLLLLNGFFLGQIADVLVLGDAAYFQAFDSLFTRS